MTRTSIKAALQKVGLYVPVRNMYRRISSPVRRERALFRRLLQGLIAPGDLCFDVGANVGQTTEGLRDCGARIIAVEPNPLCVSVLKQQFGRDPRVTLVNKAVGAEPGVAVLNYSGTDATGSIREDWPFPNRDSISVAMTTLDELIGEFGCPRFCKVDVEGFETEVFKGLSRPIPIISFEAIRAEIDRTRQVLATLSDRGSIIAANMVEESDSRYLFDDWVTIDEFSDRLEDKLPRCANVVLKMAEPRQ